MAAPSDSGERDLIDWDEVTTQGQPSPRSSTSSDGDLSNEDDLLRSLTPPLLSPPSMGPPANDDGEPLIDLGPPEAETSGGLLNQVYKGAHGDTWYALFNEGTDQDLYVRKDDHPYEWRPTGEGLGPN